MPAVTLRNKVRSDGTNRRTRAAQAFDATICAVLFAVTFFTLWHVMSVEPFSHDEAVYLTKARSWLVGTPANEWGIYRPIAMPVFGWIVLHFGDTERVTRTFGVIFGSLMIPLTYLLFRSVSNISIAFASAIVVGTSTLFLQQAAEFLDDIPSSALLIAVLWLLYLYYKSAGKSSAVYLVGPVASVAFYLRYGVVTTLALIALFSYLILLPRFLKKDGHDFSKLGKTILITFALLIPHFIYSLIATQKVLGVLSLAGKAAGREYLGQGLVQYIQWFPAELAGWPIGIATIAGIAATVVILFSRDLRKKLVAFLWIGSIGLMSFIATGILTHAEPRYVLFSLVLLTGTGIAFTFYIVARWSKIVAHCLMLAITVVSLMYGGMYYSQTRAYFVAREAAPLTIAYSEAHQAIRNDANGRGCSLWLVQYLPRASWYTGCTVFPISTKTQLQKNMNTRPNDTYYSLVYTSLKDAQISSDSAEKFGVTATEVIRIDTPKSGSLIVYRIQKAVATTTAATSSLLQLPQR